MIYLKIKNDSRFLILNFIVVMCCFAIGKAALTQREEAFLQQHLVDLEQQTLLDMIFSNLDQKLIDLLEAKHINLSKIDMLKHLKRSGFIVYAFHYRSVDHPERDGRPARLVAEHKDFPGYFLKIGFDRINKRKNIGRVLYADLINEKIERLNLALIGKIEKKLYHRAGRPDDLVDFNYVVVVQKIIGQSLKAENITREEKRKRKPKLFFPSPAHEREYEELKAAVGYSDEYRGNFVVAGADKLYLIDTEPNRFILPQLFQDVLGVSL